MFEPERNTNDPARLKFREIASRSTGWTIRRQETVADAGRLL
jgi:hypothetical protein